MYWGIINYYNLHWQLGFELLALQSVQHDWWWVRCWLDHKAVHFVYKFDKLELNQEDLTDQKSKINMQVNRLWKINVKNVWHESRYNILVNAAVNTHAFIKYCIWNATHLIDVLWVLIHILIDQRASVSPKHQFKTTTTKHETKTEYHFHIVIVRYR